MTEDQKPIDVDESQDIEEERLVDLFDARSVISRTKLVDHDLVLTLLARRMTNSGEAVDLDVNQLLSSTENIGLRVLTSLKAQPKSWMLIAGEYARAGRIDTADELLSFAINGEHIPEPSHLRNAIQIAHTRLRAPGVARELCGPVDA